MTTIKTVFKRNAQHLKEPQKSLVIEMNETPGDVTVHGGPYKKLVLQAKELSHMPSIVGEQNQFQGSSFSLTSGSCIDQSDVQPLTEIYPCSHYCIKFHNEKADKEDNDSPLSSVKNTFLYIVVALLILWIIIYTMLTQIKIV